LLFARRRPPTRAPLNPSPRPRQGRDLGAILLLAGLALAPLPGCGSANRFVFAQRDLMRVYREPEAVAQLRGREPRLPMLWTESARLAATDTPEAALAVVDEGLRFHPTDAGLLLARLELLEVLKRHEDARDESARALASLPPHPVRVALIHGALRNQLALGEVDDAWDSAQRLAGVYQSPEGAQADAWARVALELAMLGRLEDADDALARSLARGANGLGVLLAQSAERPEARAASRALRKRALPTHADHPDLALTMVVDLMADGRHAEAEAAVSTLPEPLPGRLRPDVEALRARLAILQGRVDEGLELLYTRLDQFPGDRSSLAVLEETWATRGEPSDLIFEIRLRNALPELNRQEQMRVRAMLEQLVARRKAATMGPLPPPPPDAEG
jgi:tetratricopeptide (TPR) repeat protein